MRLTTQVLILLIAFITVVLLHFANQLWNDDEEEE